VLQKIMGPEPGIVAIFPLPCLTPKAIQQGAGGAGIGRGVDGPAF
jgi:hypothetical protein